MYSSRKIDLEKTKILQCERTVKDWEEQSKKVVLYNKELFIAFLVWLKTR